MQTPPVAIRAGVFGTVFYIGSVTLLAQVSSWTGYKEIVDFGWPIIGMIAVASVMRSDVAGLKKWAWGKDGINDQMSKLNTIARALAEIAGSNKDRIDRLERHEDEAAFHRRSEK